MDAGPRFDSYDWTGGREAMLRFGPDDGPVVVLALPLLEEANRTRSFGVSILRALAARGVGSVLPELPGQGESETPTTRLSLGDLRAAFSAAPGTHAVAIRSGALLTDNARPSWHLAPQTGADLLREVARVKGRPLGGELVEVAGNLLRRALLDELASAHPSATRVVRLAGDARPADRHVDGAPLWRRAEPDNDLALAQLLAADIAEWIATCAA